MKDNHTTPLAWCGWQLNIRPDWRPLKIQGGWASGHMIIGSREEALFQIKWARIKNRKIDPKDWIKKRVRLVANESALQKKGPQAKGFDAQAWLPIVSSRKAETRAFWYGLAMRARLGIEVVINKTIDEPLQKFIQKTLIPSITTTAANEPTRWAIYGFCATSPKGYVLSDSRLYSGDIALRLTNTKKESIILRQVYPATQALERRALEQWLDRFPFKEHRRMKAQEQPANWSIEDQQQRWEGKIRNAQKRLAFPLNKIAPRESLAVAVIDDEFDRLQLIECDTHERTGLPLIEATLPSMKRRIGEGIEAQRHKGTK